MTIAATPRVAGPFAGNGTTSAFPFSFAALDSSDLYAVILDVATGAITPANISAALSVDQDSSPGGTVTLLDHNGLPSPLLAGYTLTVTTLRPIVQAVEVTNGGAFYPDVINTALDVLTILLQQLAVQTSRSLQAPLVDSAAAVTLPPAADRAGYLLGFDGQGNVAMVPTTATIGSSGGGGGGGGTGASPTPQAALGTVDGNNALFTFTAAATPTPVPMVFAGGIYQLPGTDYNSPATLLAGTTWQITFINIPTVEPIVVVLFE